MGNYDQRDGGHGGKQMKLLRKRHENRNGERDARKQTVIRTPAGRDEGIRETQGDRKRYRMAEG